MSRATSDAATSGARSGARPRDSLRWRLPAYFGALLIVVLGLFLWAAHEQVARTLVDVATDRAVAAAGEIAAPLSRSLEASMARNDEVGTDPAVVAFLASPAVSESAAARAVLAAGSDGLRRAELWDLAGRRMLEVVVPPAAPDTAAVPATYPAGDAPAGPGVGQAGEPGEPGYIHFTSPVRDTMAGAPLLGYVRRFGRVRSGGLTIHDLLGDDAVIRIGAPGDPAWTDLHRIVDAPPPPERRGRAGEFRSADGARWVGGHATMGSSDWVVWVAYPRAVITAPARAFLGRMLVVGLLFAAFSVTAAAFLGHRLTSPLRRLTRAARDIAGGDYARRVAVDRSDEIGRLSESFNEMTDRVEAAYGELRARNEQTHFALAAARIGIWEATLDSGRLACSDSMRLVLGLDDDAPLPDSVTDFLERAHPEDRDALRAVLAGHATGAEPVAMRYRARAADDTTRWIEGRARPTFDESGAPVSVLGVSIDATERHRLETQLRQSQKMEAIGQLAGGVAHDFNNLLTAIMGHGSLMLEDEPEAAARDDLREILRAGESAAGLTRQLLTFSRRQVVEPRVVDPNDVIANIEKLLRRLIGADIDLAMEPGSGLRKVKIDPGQLEQVVMNLAVNARDAMPDGGRLTISTHNTDLGRTELHRIAGLPPGAYVVMTVTDTGVGMDAEVQAHLFEPFFTTKPAGQGTGLGLATVFGIIKQSGGHIYVYSEPGMGTAFKIYLPATDEPASAADQSAARPAAVGGRESILLVEDNQPVQAIARAILERIGYQVTAASSGEEALALLADRDAGPDLVVSDLIMPGMSGPELCRRLEERYPGLKVLFTSGYSVGELERLGGPVDAMFIEKPFSPESLATRVREALAA